MTVALATLAALALGGGYVAQLVRWLRVLQREHYEPSSLPRFLGRWTSPQVGSASTPLRRNLRRPLTLSHVLLVVLFVGLVLRSDVLLVIDSALYGLLCPTGLKLRGRTSPLRWTRRSVTIAVVASFIALLVAVSGAFTARPWFGAVVVLWAVPVMLDLTVRALAPYERRRAQVFVDRAAARLAIVKPIVVAITGSFGKTSTKNHLALLVGDAAVASPRSFNNRAGLSRAINENLSDGTRVFIAEMGTYGPGEIRELCGWCPPSIAVVTAIGPVHLERMKTLDVIDAAKFEITERAPTVVVNGDDLRLRAWVERLRASGKRVVVAGSTYGPSDVRVVVDDGRWRIDRGGVTLTTCAIVAGVQVTNLACAIAAALELGVAVDDVVARVSLIVPIANRSNVAVAPSGVTVIDDTFNANPASAVAAVDLLVARSGHGRRVLVTPGLVELGTDQYGQNLTLARRASSLGLELVVVGRTNALALASGYGTPPRRFDTRNDAVAWVRTSLGADDAVLYLNDLPDHYP